MKTKLQCLWIDGQDPGEIRNKTQIHVISNGTTVDNLVTPVWGFDGSSTNQAPGDSSDCVLQPVRNYVDPTRDGNNFIVLNEVNIPGGDHHPSNTRANLRHLAEKYVDKKFWFGIEQEYTFFKNGKPLGWPKHGEPEVQGKYYCATGVGKAYGREIVEKHLEACLKAGIEISGINREVMPGQWEYQIGTASPLKVADDLIVARYLMNRIAEDYDVEVSLAAKPMKGDWNGAGAHTNFSTADMRNGTVDFDSIISKLKNKHNEHITIYGTGIEDRLTGLHETCRYDEFRSGVSDRGASVRIPWQVALKGKGYLEDRRPCADIDPYLVIAKIMETVSED